MKKILKILIIVFVILAAFGYWYWQKNIYSKDILKLEIASGRTVDLFEEVEYMVNYKNNGNVRLEEVRLVFEFPEFTVLEEGKTRRQELELEDIYPGEERTEIFKGRLAGREGEVKTARAWLSYRPKGLKPRYESSTIFTSEIKQIYLTFDIDAPSRIEAGRDLKFFLNYFSNLNYPLANLGIKIDYPSGFKFISSSPSPLEVNEWRVPLLNRAEGGRIEITGSLSGEISDQRIFRAYLGIWQDENFIVLKEISRGVEIARPLLYVFQRINNTDRYIAKPGDLLHYEIFFRNIGEEPFSDLFMVARLDGAFFDFGSVRTDYGQHNRGDNSIMWDWRDVPRLRFLNKGEEGSVDFWVRVKDDVSLGSVQNPVLTSKISIARLSEEFKTKVNSKLSIAQRGFFQDEIFGNTGPIPPRIGEKTTYTIVWNIENTYNNVSNVKAKAFLPENVSLTGKIFKEEQSPNLTFDSQSREIVWTIGDLSFSSEPKSIAFQVALTPLVGHISEVLPIIHSVRASGSDEWTESIVEGISPGINTMLPDDPTVSAEQGIIE